MSNFNEISIFAAIVERGSFVSAATALGVPKATVSRKIDELEARLGARLLQRTTRKLSLTEAGQAYYEHCERILAEIGEAERAIGLFTGGPRGNLRVSAPFTLGSRFLGRLMPEFARRYPDVRVTLLLSNSFVDLVEDNFDLALRAGQLADSSYASRTLTHLHARLVASPAYIAEKGLPRSWEDLAEHHCLALVPRDERNARFAWRLQETGDARKPVVVEAPITPLMACNDPEPLAQAAIGGEGIAFLSGLFIKEPLSSGALVSVLPQWVGVGLPLSAVYPSRRGLSPKVRVFIDFISEHLNELTP
ncbi:MAG TPA: LysR substrate-binding domain-containing protein [Burkholderiales bacterium]